MGQVKEQMMKDSEWKDKELGAIEPKDEELEDLRQDVEDGENALQTDEESLSNAKKFLEQSKIRYAEAVIRLKNYEQSKKVYDRLACGRDDNGWGAGSRVLSPLTDSMPLGSDALILASLADRVEKLEAIIKHHNL